MNNSTYYSYYQRSGKWSHSNDVIGACICSNDDLHVNVCGSAHCCGCGVNGSVAMAASEYYILHQITSHFSQGLIFMVISTLTLDILKLKVKTFYDRKLKYP